MKTIGIIQRKHREPVKNSSPGAIGSFGGPKEHVSLFLEYESSTVQHKLTTYKHVHKLRKSIY